MSRGGSGSISSLRARLRSGSPGEVSSGYKPRLLMQGAVGNLLDRVSNAIEPVLMTLFNAMDS